METKLHEHTFNVLLAEAFKEANPTWRRLDCVHAERRGAARDSARRPDILIEDPALPKVIVETAFGGDNDRDALARLEDSSFSNVNTVLAVAIPRRYESMTDNEARSALRQPDALEHSMLQRDGENGIYRFPSSGYARGSVRDLASLVQTASSPKASIEEVADRVAGLIDAAAGSMMRGMSQKDCMQIAERVYQNTPLTAFRTVAVLWMDAMLVQSHLRRCGADVDELPLSDPIPSTLADAWKRILQRNWRSIFSPAIDVLERAAARARGPVADALRELARAVEIIEAARLGDHVNIGAELFPRISVDRKTTAAFYTTPATAELLGELLVRERDAHEWDDPHLFERLRIADFACGTGSLVRAAYRRVRDFSEGRGNDAEAIAVLHRGAMEQGLKAADVSPIASHLTNSSMAIMGGGEPYGDTKIGWVSVGQPMAHLQDELTTGSLEFLKEQRLGDLFSDLGSFESGRETEEKPITAFDGTFDYIAMNPPYSRTRGGQSAFDITGLSDNERTQCQNRWGNLLKNEPAIKTAGMAASFLVMAKKKVKPGGRIGFVLPLTAAFSESWQRTRDMVVRDFEDVVAITRGGHDNDESLSADTGMGEMLLVATRRATENRGGGESLSVQCVTLRRMPLRQGEAAEFGRSVQRALDAMQGESHPVVAGDEELGQIATLHPDGGEPWSHLGVLHADLAIRAKGIADNGVLTDVAGGRDMHFACPMTTIGSLFDVGPTHHLIGHPAGSTQEIGAFVFHPIRRKADLSGANRALWSADAEAQTSLVVEPTHKGSLWNKKMAERIEGRTGHLHYARNIRWTSQSLLAGWTDGLVYGGRAWTTLSHSDERIASAFLLWANSTLGLIAHWTRGSRTQKGRGAVQVKAIQAMPCPDLSKLAGPVLDRAAQTMKDLSALELLPVCQAHRDDVRTRIDEAVVEMLGLPKNQALKTIRMMRGWWCAEPTVHGDNKVALQALEKASIDD